MINTPIWRLNVGTLVFLLLGPMLWAAQLAAVYGTQSSLCAFEALPAASIGTLVIMISVALLTADMVAMLRADAAFTLLTGSRPRDEQWGFIKGVMRGLGLLSGLAMLYAGIAATLLPACSALR